MAKIKITFVKKTIERHHCYQILGLSPDASQEDVKRAYRKLAKKYHPDIAKDPIDHKKFKLIKNAYEILTGKQKVKNNSYRAQSRFAKYDSYAPPTTPKKADEFRRKFGISKEEWLKRKAASERIRQKNSEEAYKAIKTGLLWAILFTIFVNVIFPISKKYFTEYMITKNPATGIATISYVVGREAGFTFDTQNGIIRTELRCTYYNETSYLPNGFPANKNDYYFVLYNQKKPHYYKIDFQNIHKITREMYMLWCVDKVKNNTESFNNISADVIPFFVQNIYETFGIDGLSIIYNHTTSFFQNTRYNSISFYFFKKNKLYKDIIQKYTS